MAISDGLLSDKVKFCGSFQKICYLPLNPMKEEGVETEKVAYTLPDGNTIEVCISWKDKWLQLDIKDFFLVICSFEGMKMKDQFINL